MKKSKILINSLCTIAGSLAIALPISSCSCGSNPQPEPTPIIDEPIPESEMVFDESKGVKVFTGFKQPWSAYAGYTQIKIPAYVVSIADGACESTPDNMMPDTIKTITFADTETDAEVIPLIIGKRAFANAQSVNKFVFPRRIKYVCEEAFAGCISANTIDITSWISDDISAKAFPFADINIFKDWPTQGKVSYSDKIGNFVANLYFMFTGAGLSENWIDVEFEDGTADHDSIYTSVKYKLLQHMNDEDDYRYVITGIKEGAVIPADGHFVIPAWAYALGTKWLGKSTADAKSITVDENNDLRTIYHNAFADATNLRSIDLSNTGVRTIGTMAFYHTNLSDEGALKFSPSLISIGSYAFWGSRLNKLDLSNTSVSTISIGAFKECLLTDVIFPTSNKIEEIDPYAFVSCGPLVKLSNYTESLKWIGNDAFSKCWNLESFDLGNCTKLEFIGKCAFQKCNLKEVSIPQSVWSIGDGAFSENYVEDSGIRTITIDKISVHSSNEYYEAIPDRALCSKKNPTLLAISKNIANVPTNIVAIGEYALSGAMWYKNDMDLSTATNLKTIKKNAFNWFKSSVSGTPTVSLILPTSIESIEDEVFKGASVVVSNFADLKNLKHMGKGIFSTNVSLTEVEIPSGITTIPSKTFYDDTHLTQITIPNTVQEIDAQAFDEVAYAYDVHIYLKSFTTVPNWTGEYAFGKNPRSKNIVLHIANDSLRQQWQDLFDRLKLTFKDEGKLKFTTE